MTKKILQSYRLLIKLVLMSVVPFSMLLGQSVDSTNIDSKPNASALQIGFINETALYYHYPINTSISLRTGIDFNWDYDEKKDGEGYYRSKSYYYPYDREEKYKSNYNTNNYKLTVSSLFLFKLNSFEYAKIYVGIGPSLLYSYNKIMQGDSRYTDTTRYDISYELINKVFGIGPSASIMITSHIYRSIYFISEYSLEGYYTWNTGDSNSSYYAKDPYSPNPYFSASQSHQKSNGWQLKFSKVKIGLLIEL